MSVSHYEEMYGEALAENVSKELNPEIAAVLENDTPLTQELCQYASALAHEAQTQREQFKETIINETQSLEIAEEELHAIESALEEMNVRILSEQSYIELERVWEQLDELQDRTEAISKERQERVHAIVVDMRSNGPITLQTYLYQPLSTSFPVLAECTDTLRKILMAKSSVIDSLTRRV
ncbi:hypothetical protein [Saliphagus sp. LR7]|nr:hypothetical protein [Saliphagus sp. LR7]